MRNKSKKNGRSSRSNWNTTNDQNDSSNNDSSDNDSRSSENSSDSESFVKCVKSARSCGCADGKTQCLCGKLPKKWAKYATEQACTHAAQTYIIRKHSAKAALLIQEHQSTNGDVQKYKKTSIGSFTKGLQHDANGIVDHDAFIKFLTAICQNYQQLWTNIPLGESKVGYSKAKLANPQATFFHTSTGWDTQALMCPPCPTLASQQGGAEMVELYAMALTRDVPFGTWGTDPLIDTALTALNAPAVLAAYIGPKSLSNTITPSLIFRGNSAGDIVGPFISQLLLLPLPVNSPSTMMDQKYNTLLAGKDYLYTRPDWLDAQNGNIKTAQSFTNAKLYIYNPRALINYVHNDPPCLPWLSAAHILLALSVPLNQGNPYKTLITNQGPFVTFGLPDLDAMITEVSQLALAVSWNTKWRGDLRLRPEAYGGLIDDQVRLLINRDLPSNITGSSILAQFNANGTLLLPQAYPEGSPLHPSYPSGHAATAGACATVLKAYFDGTYLFNSPVTTSVDGTTLIPVLTGPLTLDGELDKMASNMSTGRNYAGIHYRYDMEFGLSLGENVAIKYLKARAKQYNEPFTGFVIHKRNGEEIHLY
jgi:membrane-associated phospholipid phosphatase